MQPVLNVEDVRQVEQALTQEGVSLSELMRRAGAAVVQEVQQMEDVRSVVVFVGFGNNGGDGWVAAERLFTRGYQVSVVTPVAPSQIKSDLAHVVAVSAQRSNVPTLVAPSREKLDELLLTTDVVIDAMLGTGFHGEPRAPFDIWIECVNASGARVIAADVPSGLSAQTGHAHGATIVADATVTMISLKPGLLADKGRDVCGTIVVAPLAEQTEHLVVEADPVAWRVEVEDYLDVMTPPTVNVDKFERGSVLVVGGSTRFIGAPILAARAAARAGAGYVTLVVPEPVVPIAQAHLAEIPVVGMPYDPSRGCFAADAREKIAELANQSSAVVAGPGMLVNASTMAVVAGLLQCETPLVLDADALNCLARLTSNRLDSFPELIRRSSPLVLTPHRRELGRLVGMADTPPDSLSAVLDAARRIVWAEGGSEVCVVAKGNATACVGVDIALLPKPGPAALATAGSGDVLSGVMGALLAKASQSQTLEDENLPLLCSLACEMHSYAASLAMESYGSHGVMAGDVADCLGLAADALEEQATLLDNAILED
ncbi:MAG: NAD(P)H-hydrate epimerase [Coriobacteriales bacterium]|nr:NAD(P)H-hydrate epimerase [Coriobacteriales bacterium]